MNRRKIAASLAASVACFVLAATTAALNEEGNPLHNLTTKAKLERSQDFDFKAEPLADVLAFFRQKLELPMVQDPGAAALTQKPITLTLKNTQAGEALSLALRQAQLQYVVSLGVVWVGDRTYTEAREPKYYRQYDVADLLAQ